MSATLFATELSDTTFEVEVLRESVPVLVGFYRDGAGAAQIANQIRSLAEESRGKVKCCLLDAGRFDSVAREYGLNRAPGFLLFKDGEAIERVEGPAPPLVLRALLSRYA